MHVQDKRSVKIIKQSSLQPLPVITKIGVLFLPGPFSVEANTVML